MEKFHGAVVDHEGTEQTRVFKQVAELGATLRKLTDVIGTTSRPAVALFYDWEVRWALEISLGTKRLSYLEGVQEAHRPFWQQGVSTDVIESTCALESYKLVMAPHLYLLKPGVVERRTMNPWLARLWVFHFVVVGWVFFRAPDLGTALSYFWGLFT
jgi:beta-galactosidase